MSTYDGATQRQPPTEPRMTRQTRLYTVLRDGQLLRGGNTYAFNRNYLYIKQRDLQLILDF